MSPLDVLAVVGPIVCALSGYLSGLSMERRRQARERERHVALRVNAWLRACEHHYARGVNEGYARGIADAPHRSATTAPAVPAVGRN